ncbi:hypothetical protein JX265_009555 [Neoarthrinium moseri]|uniref:Life-span regulatory factor domain-containing protein n=1 Tax=Neoarthrinium moseri TaxID=1658444 RepID=A0A9P9WG10_9PEZI|nr:uncharacterized protein JN550_013134 [Neoarthrinium moseri]KAI1844929.1 hypothetical protein JX266_008945 [Neoarthrinium moseri]KAI1857622.1 hypothetical protein JN550_013134 [Neoarthrinium moseri]KAI1861588.1 hypothetical protein JX265_009555 [Neoarthrinium moseri]
MHHTRRKSGHASTNTSMTDVRKAVTVSDLSRSRRPQTLSRKNTPQTVTKLGKNPRDREREWEEARGWEDERETFPQYCMSCEKQFIPQDERFLYCSEACRKYDQNSSSVASQYPPSRHDSYGSLPFYSAGDPEPRDIIPRASPSRPSSTYFSPPTTPTSTQYTSAVSALRSLSIRPPSPPSPTTSSASLWPFTRTAATSPSTSYAKPSNFYSSTYDSGYGASGYQYGYGYASAGVASDRPLPSRKPGGYGRPKSIELVTPMVGR